MSIDFSTNIQNSLAIAILHNFAYNNVMAKKADRRTTRPLIQSVLDFTIETTSDGQGLIITAPPGKTFDLANARFQVSPDGKKLEVRVK